MKSFHRLLRLAGPRLLLSCVLLAGCHARKSEPTDRERFLASLRAALGESLAGSRAIFLPPLCLALLPKETSSRHPSASESAEALSSPSSFHALHRKDRYDRVFLIPGTSCAPLRDHLLESPVWVLTTVRPEGYVFSPAGSAPWHPPDEAETVRLHPDPADRSLWLIATAENLVAIGRNEEASSLLNLAACSGKHEARRLTALASLEAAAGNWNKALDLSNRSLRSDANQRAANLILIRALSECGRPGESLARARDFSAAFPDAETLFLLARAANAAGDHAGEISALRRLVAVAEKEHQPSGASLLYLGQALAKDGQRGQAIQALERAANAPELSVEQKRLIGELRDHLAPEKKDP